MKANFTLRMIIDSVCNLPARSQMNCIPNLMLFGMPLGYGGVRQYATNIKSNVAKRSQTS
jgi:hypothetical protein